MSPQEHILHPSSSREADPQTATALILTFLWSLGVALIAYLA